MSKKEKAIEELKEIRAKMNYMSTWSHSDDVDNINLDDVRFSSENFVMLVNMFASLTDTMREFLEE